MIRYLNYIIYIWDQNLIKSGTIVYWNYVWNFGLFLGFSIQINIVDICMIVRSYDLWDVNFTRNLDAWIWQMAIIGEEGKRGEITMGELTIVRPSAWLYEATRTIHLYLFSLLPFKLANASSDNKVSLQFSLKINFSNFLYIIFCVNFKNLIVKFYILYILNMRIKFRLNWILITIRLINLFFIRNFRS